MNNNRLKLVIFDKDGLIMDTEKPVFNVWREVLSQRGLSAFTREHYTRFIGFSRNQNIVQLSELYPEVDCAELFEACSVSVKQYIDNNPIDTMPGLLELLDLLDNMRIKKAVATSSRRHNAEITLKKCDIFHRFDVVISGDMVENSKPAPDIFLKAAEIMKVSPGECLVLEDSPAGVRAAHAAGIPVIVVPDMVKPSDEILSLCECRCDSLHDVVKYLSL